MSDNEYFKRHLAGADRNKEKEERLNDAVPEGTLIKMLAKEKRDLQLENLELRRQIAILRDDNEALKKYCSKLVANSGTKDMSKLINSMTNLWSQISKRMDPIRDLCSKTDDLKMALMAFVEECEKQSQSEANEDSSKEEDMTF